MTTQGSTRDKTQDRHEPPQREDLDRRYGRIGIQAVAAALRYPSDSKNPEYAPVEIRPSTDDREAA